MDIVPAFTGCANASRPLIDSPTDEMEFTEDQRAFLESIAIPDLTDADIEAMHLDWLAREEAERVAAEWEFATVQRAERRIASDMACSMAQAEMIGAMFRDAFPDRRTA